MAEIPLSLQPTLLRVLETWQVRPVGSARDVAVDVRVVATTNRELLAMVQEGLFRSDLYARLAVGHPPAAAAQTARGHPGAHERPARTLRRPGRPLTPDLQEPLLVYDWR